MILFSRLAAYCGLLLTLFTLALPAKAEQVVHTGPYEIHYVAFNSTFLPAQVARSYGISRSRYSAVLNLTVLDTRSEQKQAVTAQISGTARNLLGTTKNLKFREVTEGQARYYIAEVSFSNEETFRFEIDITPPQAEPYTLKFQQKFYSD